MFDSTLLRDQLEAVLEALERIPRRFADIKCAGDFSSSAEGVDRMDAICMILIATGEAFRKIDRKTEGRLLARYPQVDWPGVRGVRDAMAHGYFDIDAEAVFGICRDDIPALIETVKQMIVDLADCDA